MDAATAQHLTSSQEWGGSSLPNFSLWRRCDIEMISNIHFVRAATIAWFLKIAFAESVACRGSIYVECPLIDYYLRKCPLLRSFWPSLTQRAAHAVTYMTTVYSLPSSNAHLMLIHSDYKSAIAMYGCYVKSSWVLAKRIRLLCTFQHLRPSCAGSRLRSWRESSGSSADHQERVPFFGKRQPQTDPRETRCAQKQALRESQADGGLPARVKHEQEEKLTVFFSFRCGAWRSCNREALLW